MAQPNPRPPTGSAPLLFLIALLSSVCAVSGETCELFPIALSAQSLSNATPGAVLSDIYNGAQAGNFGWLTWGGSPSEPTLVKSLTQPGDSASFVNPDNLNDHSISAGDWVRSKPGVSNSKAVRDALEKLKAADITVPVWDQARGSGEHAGYRVSGFARVRLLTYQLPGQNRISARFVAYVTCGNQNAAPVANAGPDLTNAVHQLPVTLTLNGSVSDNALPAGGTLTSEWNVLSGPGTVTFANNHMPATSATFTEAGIYLLQLSATDSELTAADTVVVSINRQNQPPQASPQSVTLNEDTTADILLTGSDSDNDPLSFLIVALPQYGTLSGTPPQLTYTPKPDYNGADSFTFKVSDGQLDSAIATVSLTINAVNDPPAADAQSVTNREDTLVAITLSGSDIEGSPLTCSIVNGPTNGTLTGSAPNLTYTPNANYFGADVFSFKVNDGTSDSAPGVVAITILPVDDAPIVDAGAEQLIVLPTNSVTLSGSVLFDAFPDSQPNVEWSLVNGPATVSFSNPSNETTTVSFSQSGEYALRLTATDSFLSSSDDVIVTVNAPPVVHAGPGQTNTLPGMVTLAGSAQDDGVPANQVLTVKWSLATGPGPVVFADDTATNTTASFSQSGIYVLRLTASDSIASSISDVTVLINRAPIAGAGSDQVVTNLETTLTWTAFDDGLPAATLVTTWSQVFGPGIVTFSPQTSTNSQSNTTATFTEPGTYVVRLTASDSLATSSDEVTILVNAAPTISVSTELVLNFPAAANLTATAEDDGIPSGDVLSLHWSRVSGSGTVTFDDALASSTTASFSTPGTYVLQLAASDTLLTTTSHIIVIVNQVPLVNAGLDLRVTVGDEFLLQGLVNDDGLPTDAPLEINWSLVSGSGLLELGNPNTALTSARFREVGTYVLRLTASDSLATNSDEVTVTVLPVNHPPVVSAGPKQLVMFPSSAILPGFVSDDGLPEGGAAVCTWSKLSGPGTVTFANIQAANTTATFSDAGDYILRLTANDSLLSSFADVKITVRTPAMNQPPIASAGSDKVVGLTNVVQLDGSIQDDGLPQGAALSTSWTVVSGPGSVTFGESLQAATTASFSALGTYVLRLTASDSQFSHSDDVNITVYPFNQPPVVDAGPDQTVTLPDPDLLYPNSFAITNVSVSPARSLLAQAHWNNAIGQPGLTGKALGPDATWVMRNCLAVDGSNLVVAGAFTNANGVWAKSLARYDGANWFSFYDTNALPGGNAGEVIGWLIFDCGASSFCNEIFDCTAIRGQEVFAGGLFKDLGNFDGFKDMSARWDGQRWRSWVFKEAGNHIRVIKAAANKVYVGGYFAFQPTNATSQTITNLPWSYSVATWDGTNWGALGSGITDIRNTPNPFTPGLNHYNAYVTSMAVATNGDVYVAGDFLMPTPTGIATNVAKWNGSAWMPLSSGLKKSLSAGLHVTGMALMDNGDLHVGGTFTNAGGFSVRNVARWDGTRWWPLGTGPANGVNTTVEAIAIHGRDVYVGGSFTEAGGLSASRIAKWDGQFWSPLGSSTSNGIFGTVFSLAADETGVYVGGQFTQAGGLPANNLAKWEFTAPPVKEVELRGLVTDDGLPTGGTLARQWTKVSGPGEVRFADPLSAITTAAFSKAGAYLLRLTADDSDLAGQDEVAVTIRANQPPKVSAGLDQVIGLDEPLALYGFVSDDGLPDGAPVHHVWQQIYGPGTVTFDDSASTNATARFGQQGTYVLRLSANDSQFTTLDEVTVVVMARNQPPSVFPGSSATVTFPNSHTLNSTVTDDGSPTNGALSVAWSVFSGPGQVTFNNANVIQPTVSFSTNGIYVLRLTATDSELTSTGHVTITVNLPNNNPPVVNAGPDQTVSNLFMRLQGNVTDDGKLFASALDVSWSRLGTGGTVSFANSNSPTTAVTFSQPGIYTLQLTARDGTFIISDSVNITIPNQAPAIVNAGPDRTISLPTNSVQLSGSAVYPGTFTITWFRDSGPGSATFSGATTLTPTITFSTAGTNVIHLRVNVGGVNYDDTASVIVRPAGNVAPVVNAGLDQTLFLPTNSVVLNGTVTDDGLPVGSSVTMLWTQVAGPGAATISQPLALNPEMTFLALGTYLFRLTAHDGALTNGDDVIITVKPPLNTPPIVSAGADITTRVTNVITLDGLVTDDAFPTNGLLSAFWRKLSGPAIVTFGSANASAPAANNLSVPTTAAFSLPGIYVLRLQADDSEYFAFDDLTVTVLGVDDNLAPLVNAGLDASTVAYGPFILSGSVSDDGLPAGVSVKTLWAVVSGPARVYFSYAAALTPYAQFSAAGTYVLRLTANDTRLTAFDDVVISVSAPTNRPPFVFAGLPSEITRPFPALLQGVVLDDGLPIGHTVTTTWNKVSGPGNITFVPDANDPLALAYFSAAGEYMLRLTADDSQYVVTDEVTINVLPGTNAPPDVNAGPDFVAALAEPASLATDVSDDGLEQGLLQISWSKISGPGTVSFSTLNGAYRATFSAEGEYTLRLTAHDGSLTNSDDVMVTVVDAGPPVAEIFAPTDGGIVTAPAAIIGTAASAILKSYVLEYRLADSSSSSSSSSSWSLLASNTVSVVSNSLALFDPSLLLNGIYELRLTATDTIGCSATTEPVTIIVDRNLKIGHFTISFNDLTVPVPGLPLQITRTYDSRAAAAGIQGDFGIGWTLDIRNVRLQKNRPLGNNWEETTTGSPWDLSLAYHLHSGKPRIVTITFPDGRVQKFQLVPNPMDQALLPIDYPQWRFVPIGNTRGTLEPAGIDEVDGNFLAVIGSIPGAVDLYDLNFFFDSFTSGVTEEELQRYPTLFRYTTPEGYKYLIDEIDGLQSVTDPNGNTLLIGTNGLTWANAVVGTNSLSIAFQRDHFGRITNIVDAAGHAMRYGYGANGDLVSFTDRVGNTNGFAYTNSTFIHHLTGIIDGRGITPVQNQYDADGRLIANLDAFGNAIGYGHDLANNREYVTNRLGHVTISEYDEHGNVTRVIDPLGGVTLSSYDANGNLLATVDPLNRTNHFTYDALDNRLTATDPLGNTTRFTYGAQRRVTSVTDPRGSTITNVFDANGNLLSMRDPLGNVTRFGYDSQGLPVAVTNALGHVMRFAYDANGRLTNEVDTVGHATGYQRDANGNLLKQTTTRTIPGSAGVPPATETVSVSFLYDAQSRLTNSIFPDGSTTSTIYNSIGKPSVTIDQQGRATLMEYDGLGRVTRAIYPDGNSDSSGFDAEGRRTSSTNRLGQVTRFDYDANGRSFRTVMPDGTSTTNYFDLAGQLVASTDARGNSTFYGYDGAGRSVAVTNALSQVSRSLYDAAGNVTNAVDALGRSTRFVYDALNRRMQTVFADGTTQTTWFDALGRRTHEQDQAGKVTAFAYDNLGRLTAVTNALGHVTSYAYDELGQQLSQTDANNHTTLFEYDSLGRRVKRTLPGGQVETYGYNIGGLLTNKTDFNGYVTTYQYDGMNRLLVKVPDPRRGEPAVTFAYNVLGLRTNMTDSSGSTAYSYDGRNRLVQKARAWGGVALSVSLNYGYDANGNLTNIVSSDANGIHVAYEYDPLNRLSAVDDTHVGRTAYTYDQVGNLKGYTYPNLLHTEHIYDGLNRLTNLASTRSLTAIANYAYAVSAAGHRTNAMEQLFASALNTHPSTINRIYTYDDVYRLAGESINGTPAFGSAGYGYDPVGNRLSRAVTSLPLLPQSFGFDANDRLNSDSYDANGNTLFGAGFGQTHPDQYDFENRLVTRRTTAGLVNIWYDGDGNRVRKTVTTATNTVTTFYVVDELNPTGYAQVLEEHVSQNFNAPALQTVYCYGSMLISQDRLNGSQWTTSFYGYDGHHNVRFLTDENGNVTDTYDYDAFGNLLAASGNTPNVYLFTGEQYDLDLGLYYLRARYHNTDTGRFWTQDSFEGFGSDPSSLHKYTYCGNNPLNAYDPSGHVTLNEVAIAMGIGAGLKVGFNVVANAIYGHKYEISFSDMYSGGDAWHDTWTGSLEGLVGLGIGKVAFWAIGKAAPYLLRYTPTFVMAFNKATAQLGKMWQAAEAAWARLESAIVQGSEAAMKSAQIALLQARTAVSTLSNFVDDIAVRLGFRTATSRATQLELGFANEFGGTSGLVIGRSTILNRPGVLGPGEYRLTWQTTVKDWDAASLAEKEIEWLVNQERLLNVMKLKLPIRDASPVSESGFFLDRERNLLRAAGWLPEEGYWLPPR